MFRSRDSSRSGLVCRKARRFLSHLAHLPLMLIMEPHGAITGVPTALHRVCVCVCVCFNTSLAFSNLRSLLHALIQTAEVQTAMTHSGLETERYIEGNTQRETKHFLTFIKLPPVTASATEMRRNSFPCIAFFHKAPYKTSVNSVSNNTF